MADDDKVLLVGISPRLHLCCASLNMWTGIFGDCGISWVCELSAPPCLSSLTLSELFALSYPALLLFRGISDLVSFNDVMGEAARDLPITYFVFIQEN